jgi:heme exporter protein D|tara:strand:- start:1229 stop:1423 length:195 start_codon:yes stop_codon:yes gene_type:complete
MYFDSISEILFMDGHGLYVWMSYLAALLIVLVNYFSVRSLLRKERKSLSWSVDKHSLSDVADEP